MRSILFVSFMLYLSQALASSDILTSQVYYRYIGDSTGNVNEYEIIFNIYQPSSTQPTSTPYFFIQYHSSCGDGNEMNPPWKSVQKIIPLTDQCADSDTGSAETFVYLHVFKYVLSLPPCSDWRLSLQRCCRPKTTNTSNKPMCRFNASFTLDNSKGHNNAVKYLEAAPKALCKDRIYYWNRYYNDPDGDSIHIEVESVIDGSTLPIQPVTYNLGYSKSYPIDIDNVIGYRVAPKTGNLTFYPKKEGDFLLGFLVKEYKWDTISQSHYLVSSRYDETLVRITKSCHHSKTKGHFTKDTIHLNYWDAIVNIELNVRFFRDSYVPSDFKITKPDGSPHHIKLATLLGSDPHYFDAIRFKTVDRFDTNGVFTLKCQLGSDGHTLIGDCGDQMTQDVLYLVVSNAPTTAIAEHEIKATIQPNPADQVVWVETDAIPFYYEIIARDGSVIQKGQGHDQTSEIITEAIPSGYYLLRIENNGLYSTQPLTIFHP